MPSIAMIRSPTRSPARPAGAESAALTTIGAIGSQGSLRVASPHRFGAVGGEGISSPRRMLSVSVLPAGRNAGSGPGSSASETSVSKTSLATGSMPGTFTRWVSSLGLWYWSWRPVWNITAGTPAMMNA
jgi:hypothetical protein